DFVDRAGVALGDLLLRLEVGAARAVPALVGAALDVAVGLDALENLLHALPVARITRADEEVGRGVELARQRLEAGGVLVGERLRRNAFAVGLQRNRFAVLIGAGEEEYLLPALAPVAGEHVRGDHRVGVAEVGRRIHI